jgi:hypothetical protein
MVVADRLRSEWTREDRVVVAQWTIEARKVKRCSFVAAHRE